MPAKMNKYTRFLQKVQHWNFDPFRCWEWQGADKGGDTEPAYGMAHNGDGKDGAHRIAYELFVGPIPPGYDVCHECDNRPCCNPDHLFVGTRTDNMQDAKAKGRLSRGEKHSEAIRRGARRSYAKLTVYSVRRIVKRLKSGDKAVEIARDYEVTESAISAIRSGKNWADVTGLGKDAGA